MGFNSLGSKTVLIQKKSESYDITQGFVCDAVVGEGQMVKIDASTGIVSPVAASSDVAIGSVAVGNQTANTKVVVDTQFVKMMYVQTGPSQTTTIGMNLVASGVVASGDNKGMNVAVQASTGEQIQMMALEAKAPDLACLVGVFRVFTIAS